MKKKLKVLIVDDTELNLLLVTKFVTALGHTPILARNGQEAVDLFGAEEPDLVLMDVMMPVMNGFEATARIREISGAKWVPVIFLSAKIQEQDQVMGLEVGGDDYLTKPVNLTMLAAKIKAMQRIAEMQRVIAENARQLALYREENERELELAKHVLERIIRTDRIDAGRVRHWSLPARNFSGDVIAAATTPGDVLHVILADGTGHGLSAALNAMPVIEVFYGMTEKGFSVSSIARELNRKVRQLLPTERFVAAVLASIDSASRTIRLWNGGLPPVFFVDDHGVMQREWHSAHPPLGILSEEEFDARTETFHWQDPGLLYIYSDGLAEAENAAGERFGVARVAAALSPDSSGEGGFRRLLAEIDGFLGGQPGVDDISLLSVLCPSDGEHGGAIAPPVEEPALPQTPGRWKLEIKLEAAELKSLDIAPLLLNWLSQLRVGEKQCREFFVVFTELFNNALDHGILKLDSALKTVEDGFDRYLTAREQRLASLERGTVEIGLEHARQEDGEFLRLRVADSGAGFDVDSVLGRQSGEAALSGRGIALVQSLCAGLEYRGGGNEAIALYRLRHGE